MRWQNGIDKSFERKQYARVYLKSLSPGWVFIAVAELSGERANCFLACEYRKRAGSDGLCGAIKL